MKIIFLLLCSVLLFSFDTPYSQKKFRDVLKKTKLQAPESSYNPRYSVKYGEFENYANKYFYLQDGKYMVFEICGKKYRSELRQQKEWKVETNIPQELFARVKLFPLDQKREFTFLQIHANSNRVGDNGKKINKPLLRITWWKEQKNRYNHLWAVIRLSGDVNEQKYMKIDMGTMPKGFFDVKIAVKNSQMRIYLNNKLKIDMSVDYWEGYWNYFKAGVYNQDDGCSRALFDKLTIR